MLLAPFLLSLIALSTAQNIAYSGRVVSGQNTVQFDWSAVRIDYTFTGSSIAATIQDYGNLYDVYIDNNFYTVVNVTGGQTYYTIATGLSSGAHSISMIKRTEAFVGGTVTFSGFTVDGNLVSPTPAKSVNHQRKLEMIGDSITCGYGVLGLSPTCSFSAQTESAYYSYGSILSRALGAQLQMECWSGKGMVRNYGDPNPTSTDPLPTIYPRSLASDTNSADWSFSWIPDAVVINLGTNDFSTTPNPPNATYTQGYVNFVNYIRGKYASNANLKIFAVCGPLISGVCCDLVKQVSTQMNLHYIDLQNILTFPNDYGCDYHPAISGQQKMADIALPIIQQVMNWYGAPTTGSASTTGGSTASTAGGSTASTGAGSTGVATITAKVVVSIQVGDKSLDLNEFVKELAQVLGIPTYAISQVTVDADQSSSTVTVIEFEFVNVLREDGMTRVDPVAAALKLKQLVDSKDPSLTSTTYLAGMQVLDGGSGAEASGAVQVMGGMLFAFVMSLLFV